MCSEIHCWVQSILRLPWLISCLGWDISPPQKLNYPEWSQWSASYPPLKLQQLLNDFLSPSHAILSVAPWTLELLLMQPPFWSLHFVANCEARWAPAQKLCGNVNAVLRTTQRVIIRHFGQFYKPWPILLISCKLTSQQTRLNYFRYH